MVKTRAVSLTVLTFCASSLIAQTPTVPPSSSQETFRRTDEETERRIAQLAAQFETFRQPPTAAERAYPEMCRRDCSSAAAASARREIDAIYVRRRQSIDELAVRIHREVDNFIAKAITPADLNRGIVESGLRLVLSSASYESPVAFTSEQNGRRLAIAYMLSKAGQQGPGGTSVTLRMYIERDGHLVLADATGSDFEGYASISVVELRSPAPREAWFLLSGKLTGANGPNTRMRIYAFDSQRFGTVWMPENVWGAFAIAVDDMGFTVKGNYYRGGAREERYFLSDDGVYRVTQD